MVPRPSIPLMGQQIPTRAKRLAAGPGQDHDPDLAIPTRAIISIDQLVTGDAPKRIEGIGSIDRDLGDTLVHLIREYLEKPFLYAPC